MRKIKGETLHRGPGRPRLNVVNRGISITDEDAETFRRYGFGSLSAGIRRSAHLLRRTKEEL